MFGLSNMTLDCSSAQRSGSITLLRKAINIASRHKGHMGAHVMRPVQGSNLYEIAVRFATPEDAERWIDSEDRQKLIADIREHIQEPEKLHIKSGIDYWFTSVAEGREPEPSFGKAPVT